MNPRLPIQASGSTMWRRPVVLFLCVTVWLISGLPGLAADGMILDPQQVFEEAARAYDEGNYEDARRLYEAMVQAGYRGQEIFFNLGNAYFRLGQSGFAVFNFRRAWRFNPRDPDVLTNLSHAQKQTSAIPANQRLLDAIWSHYSAGEWAGLALVAWWVGAILLLLSFFSSRNRRALRKGVFACSLVLVIAGTGFLHWRGLRHSQEAVVIGGGYQAMFAPLEGAQPHFELPEGTIVRVQEESEGWLRVSLNQKTGWLPKDACAILHL